MPINAVDCTWIRFVFAVWFHDRSDLLYLLCCPVLIPQRVGTLIPTDGRTVNLSLLHWPGKIRLKKKIFFN